MILVVPQLASLYFQHPWNKPLASFKFPQKFRCQSSIQILSRIYSSKRPGPSTKFMWYTNSGGPQKGTYSLHMIASHSPKSRAYLRCMQLENVYKGAQKTNFNTLSHMNYILSTFSAFRFCYSFTLFSISPVLISNQ